MLRISLDSWKELEKFSKCQKRRIQLYNQDHSDCNKTLENENIKAVKEFTHLRSNITSTKRDIDTRLSKA